MFTSHELFCYLAASIELAKYFPWLDWNNAEQRSEMEMFAHGYYFHAMGSAA